MAFHWLCCTCSTWWVVNYCIPLAVEWVRTCWLGNCATWFFNNFFTQTSRECEIRRTVGPKGVFFVGVRQTSIHHRSLWPANRAAVSDQSVPPFQWFYLLNLHQNAVRQILPKTAPKNGQKSCWVHVRCHFHLTEWVDWSKSKHGRVLNHNLKFARHFW